MCCKRTKIVAPLIPLLLEHPHHLKGSREEQRSHRHHHLPLLPPHLPENYQQFKVFFKKENEIIIISLFTTFLVVKMYDEFDEVFCCLFKFSLFPDMLGL